jgi:hypothetical protein
MGKKLSWLLLYSDKFSTRRNNGGKTWRSWEGWQQASLWCWFRINNKMNLLHGKKYNISTPKFRNQGTLKRVRDKVDQYTVTLHPFMMNGIQTDTCTCSKYLNCWMCTLKLFHIISLLWRMNFDPFWMKMATRFSALASVALTDETNQTTVLKSANSCQLYNENRQARNLAPPSGFWWA